MDQEGIRARTRHGSLVPRQPSAANISKSTKKGKQTTGKVDVKKQVRIQQDPREEEIIKELNKLDLDKDRIRTGTALIYDPIMEKPRCIWDNETPESPERVIAVMQKIKECGLLQRCQLISPRSATKEDLLLVHSLDYVDMIISTQKMSTVALRAHSEGYDLVYFHTDTYVASCMAVGCVLQLVDYLMKGSFRNGLAVVRPPGHQAQEDAANSYCIFNTLAIAATYARKVHGVDRILIVDWDIYHGQGTQYIFEEDPRVLLFSIHRYEHGDFWPHLAESDCTASGTGNGKGYNINLPWNKTGMSDADYYVAFYKLLLPIAHEYRPNLILVAAGFNSVLGDPQGKMSATPACFAHLTHMLMPLANGKLLLSLEGGFNLQATADATAACLKVLLGDPCPQLISTSSPCQSAMESISAVISVHRKFWKCLQNRELSSWREVLAFPEVNEVTNDMDETLDVTMMEVMRPLPPYQTGLLYDERMKEHYNMWDFQHPEQPQRISQIFARHEELHLVERCFPILAQPSTESQLEMCHGLTYVTSLKSTREMNSRELHRQSCEYNSIFISSQTYDSALLAVGSLFNVVEAVLTGQVQNGVALIRPPGHHAERDVACGFCFFNNVALAARFAQNLVGHKIKVLILDWDVHHGNGTQHMFEDDPSVLYISIHRYDNGSFFPNTEDADYTKVGIDAGEGFNVNIPWNGSKMGDAEYMTAFHRLVMPISYQFQPDLVLVSAGFDAAQGDPLGGCKVSPECYAHLTHMLLGLAGGRVVMALEGGYNLTAISESMAMCTRTLLGDTPPYLQPGEPLLVSAAETISNVVSVHHKFWPCLRLLAPELELQKTSKGRTWAQQPTSSPAPAPETRVQVSQSRRTSMWLQQQVPTVNIPEEDMPQVSQSRRSSTWSQQQIPFSIPEVEFDSQVSESRRNSLWRQNPFDTELDMTGRPIQTSLKLMWPQEPPASPMAILPKDHKFQPDKPALGLTVPSSADASAVRALILSSKAGARPRVKMDTEHGKGLQEEDDDAAPSQSVDDQKGKLGFEVRKSSSKEGSSTASSTTKLKVSSDDDFAASAGRRPDTGKRCPEPDVPLPPVTTALGQLHAVSPLMWCPHLEFVKPLPPVGLNVSEPCSDCGSVDENWVCLICYKVYCGRYVNEHMMIHGLRNEHYVVLSYTDLSVWCYGCESYVHNEVLLPAKEEAHRKKFGEELHPGA
ncbi:histone deacetylase 6 isoform X2 [Scyliorhinus torazame]|uniref:histone deacetylase 6 isoform X2 n=1 Tax=Scyliorhinus torazame TaxID=75743 RepID=UPI003B59DD3A